MKNLKHSLLLLMKAALSSAVLMASAAVADNQIITVSPAEPAFGESDESVTFSVVYATDPENTGVPGFGLKMYFNSAVLEGKALNVNPDIGGQQTGPSVQADSADGDNDASTDKVVVVAWIENTKQEGFGDTVSVPWPEVEDFTGGVSIIDVTFGRADTTFTGKSQVNFILSTAAGFDAKANSFDIIFKDDETAPVVTLGESSVTIEAVGPLTSEDNATAFADFIKTITVEDNKDTLTTENLDAFVTQDGALVAAPEGFAPGTYEITFIASDSSGNKSEGVVVTLTVADTTLPVLSGVSDVALSAADKNGASSAGVLAATALDSVDGQVAVAYSVGGADVGDNFPLGETTVTVKAADAAGNMAEGSLVVTVSDTNSPIIASTAPVSLEADGATGYAGSKDAILAAVSATDNVDDAPMVTLSDDSLGDLPLGPTQVAVTVKDAAGNSTEGTVSVTVVDTTKPTITVSNLVLTVDSTDEVVASSDARVTAWIENVAATDIVDGATTVTNSALPENFAVGETVVTFTSSDAAGNEATAEGTVILTVGPAVSVAAPITIVSVDGAALPATQAQIAAFIAAASATDFAGSTLSVTNDAPDSFPVGATVVTFTAVDSDDRQGQRSSTVTVVAPAEENDTDNDGMDDLFEVNNGLDPNADDAAGDADGDGRSNLDEYKEGKDPNLDDVAPVLTIAEGVVTLEATGELGYAGSLDSVIAAVTATDLVDPAPVVSVSDTVPDPLPLGDTQVTVLATDAEGNVGEGTVAVTVVDTTAPVISGADLLVLTVDTPISVASSDARVVAWLAGVSGSDIVDGATTVTNSALPAEFPVGETIITFTSTDAADNVATKAATVLVAVGPCSGSSQLDNRGIVRWCRSYCDPIPDRRIYRRCNGSRLLR